MFCPALTDGSIGDMIYFHSYRNEGLVLDIVSDIRRMNDHAIRAKKTGVIILGGGVVKHHILNANLMRNGADFGVFVNTGQEYDGSDAGARPDEAISWGKLRLNANPVKVHPNFPNPRLTRSRSTRKPRSSFRCSWPRRLPRTLRRQANNAFWRQ